MNSHTNLIHKEIADYIQERKHELGTRALGAECAEAYDEAPYLRFAAKELQKLEDAIRSGDYRWGRYNGR